MVLWFVLLALMSGSAHRAGGNLAEGSIKYNERNRNVYLGKVCAQMYTMKTRGNEPTFSINERKCAATSDQILACGGRKKSPRTHLSCRLYFTFGPLRSKNVF